MFKVLSYLTAVYRVQGRINYNHQLYSIRKYFNKISILITGMMRIVEVVATSDGAILLSECKLRRSN